MRPFRLLALSLTATLVLMGCAGAGSAPTPSAEPTDSPTVSASPSASPPAVEASEAQSLDDEYGLGGGYGRGDSGSDASGSGDTGGGGSGATTTVMIMGFDFPDDITVAAGTTVTFMNHDGGAHTVTEGSDGVADADAAFDQEVPAGGTIEINFDEPGAYHVTCQIHPTMNMVITVEG